MTNEFKEWFYENAIWMPDNDAMMFDVWNSVLEFTSKKRTCENCKYFHQHYLCLEVGNGGFKPESDFGCNKFKKKEN